MKINAFGVIVALAAVLTPATGTLAGLPKCHEEATAHPDGWQQIVAPYEDIAFALPPGKRDASEVES
jgi:hypothetical protein